MMMMALAPIRGAPPGAPIPDFPAEKPRVKPVEPNATPPPGDQRSPVREKHTAIEIGGGGITLTFRVIPELPAIARASMTIHIGADAAGPLGSLRMSAANARAFLTDLRNGCSPIVATGDEHGTVQIEFRVTEAGSVVSVRRPDQQHILGLAIIDRRFAVEAMADELLADMGA